MLHACLCLAASGEADSLGAVSLDSPNQVHVPGVLRDHSSIPDALLSAYHTWK